MWAVVGVFVAAACGFYLYCQKQKHGEQKSKETMDEMDGATMNEQIAKIVFNPSQCQGDVDTLIDKFTGLESNGDLNQLQTLMEESSDSDRVAKAVLALKSHLVLPEEDALRESSVETYMVEVEAVMREYVRIIVNASRQGHDAVGKTEALLKQIDSIFNLVDGLRHISDQTGLLALNAAIEAARTGDVGRSYSYMAKEVQRLSAQSENFGGDIKAEMNKAKKSVQSTTALVDEMVVSDLKVALETRSGMDQLIGQLQGLSVVEAFGFSNEDVYSKILTEMHKIIVIVLMKVDIIERLGLVDAQFSESLSRLNGSLKSLYTTKVVKNS